jgi:hypothetical protein
LSAFLVLNERSLRARRSDEPGAAPAASGVPAPPLSDQTVRKPP